MPSRKELKSSLEKAKLVSEQIVNAGKEQAKPVVNVRTVKASSAVGKPGKFPVKLVFGIIAVIVIASLVFVLFNPDSIFLASLSSEEQQSSQPDALQPAPAVTTPQYLVRGQYFKEAFQPNRSSYELFKQASEFLKIPESQVPAFFTLNSEEEIFSELPSIPADFGEIAYMLASGRYYAIGLLDEGYFKQPEFYPDFKKNAFKYWTQPDPQYWTPVGYGTYPSDQEDSLKIGEREDFTAVVFFYTGWGVQGFQGVTLAVDSESLKHFDITITPDTFLSSSSFPKFTKDWAHRVLIKGRLKPGVPAGTYTIGINVVRPPADKSAEWQLKYRNLYFDAAGSLRPSRNQVEFLIHVIE